MEIVFAYIVGGLVLTYLALIVIDYSDRLRSANREREIIKSIIKEGRY